MERLNISAPLAAVVFADSRKSIPSRVLALSLSLSLSLSLIGYDEGNRGKGG